MSQFPSALLTLTTGVAAYAGYQVLRRVTQSQDAPPLADGWLPGLGHTHILMGDQIKVAEEIASKRAAGVQVPGVVKWELITGDSMYFVTDPEAIKTILTSGHLNARVTLDPRGLQQVDMFEKGLFFNSHIESWKANRKFFLDSLTKPKFINAVPLQMTSFLQDIIPLLDECAETSTVLPMPEVFGSIALDMILAIACSHHDNATKHILQGALANLTDREGTQLLRWLKNSFQTIDFFMLTPHFMYTYLPAFRKKAEGFKVVYKDLNDYMTQMIADRMELLENDSSPENMDLLTSFIMAARDGNQNNTKITPEQILPSMREVLLGGTTTTANTLTFLVYELARNPDIQEQLFEEVQQHLTPESPLDKDVLSKLVLLQAALNETLRMYPVTTMLIRHAKEDLHVVKYKIPSNSMVAVSNLVNSRDPAHFDEPHCFKPFRFLQKRDSNLGGPLSFGFAMMPFGYGVRKCPGEALGMMEMKSVMASLVLRYKFHLAESTDPIRKRVSTNVVECTYLPVILEKRCVSGKD